MKITFVDSRIKEFKTIFEDVSDVYCIQGDLKDELKKREYDYVIIPGNSFGCIYGSYYEIISNYFRGIEEVIQRKICEEYHGDQPVGTSMVIYHNRKKIIYTPTMTVPSIANCGVNAYYAFKSALVLIKSLEMKDCRVLVTSFCTGSNQMTYETSAKQMRLAYQNVILQDPISPSISSIYLRFNTIRSTRGKRNKK